MVDRVTDAARHHVLIALGRVELPEPGLLVLQDHPDRQQLRLRRHPDDTELAARPVPVPGDQRGHVGAVQPPGRHAGRVGPGGEVPAHGDRSGQVAVAGVDAGVQHGHGHAGALGAAPRLGQLQRVDHGSLPAPDVVGARRHRCDRHQGPGQHEGAGPPQHRHARSEQSGTRGSLRSARMRSESSVAKAKMLGRCSPTARAGRPSTCPDVVSTRYGPACRTEPACRTDGWKRSATVPWKGTGRSPGVGLPPAGTPPWPVRHAARRAGRPRRR